MSHFQPLPPDFDIHDARRASSLRVLDVWSNLAERYTRRLDEDDIVDLITGEVVKDRGVLRGSSQQYDIGCFADASGSYDVSSDGAAEDDVDELDAFTEQADISGELAERERLNRVPPVQVMDPADAQDLRDFLEAEKMRKEMWGGEEEVSSTSDDGGNQGLQNGSDEEGEEEESVEEEDVVEELEKEAVLDAVEVENFTPDDYLARPAEEESDDELGKWDLDEGNTVYQIPQRSDIKTEVEVCKVGSDVKSDSDDLIIVSSSEESMPRTKDRSTKSKSKNTKTTKTSKTTKNSKTTKTSKTKLQKLPSDSKRMSTPVAINTRARKRKRVLSEDYSVDGVVDDTDGHGDEPAPSSSSLQSDKPLAKIQHSFSRGAHSALTAPPSKLQLQEQSRHPYSHLQHTPQSRLHRHSRSQRYPPAQSQSDPITDPFAQAQSHSQHPFTPIQDPRAQFIISQAMQQLSSLMTMTGPSDLSQPQQYPWPPSQLPTYSLPPYKPCQHCTPLTLSQCHHHTHPSSSPSSSSSQRRVRQSSVAYATPSHPHPYPYTPSFSGDTLPPSSPDPSSSPPRPSSSETRAKSILRRSKSRGRRVSFRIEHERSISRGTSRSRSLSVADMSEWEIEVGTSPVSSPVYRRGRSRSVTTNNQKETDSSSMIRGRSKRVNRDESPPRPTPRNKGKALVEVQEDESSKLYASMRGKTPGPPTKSGE